MTDTDRAWSEFEALVGQINNLERSGPAGLPVFLARTRRIRDRAEAYRVEQNYAALRRGEPNRDSTDGCPEWNCPNLSSQDRREGKTCPDHPCTCSKRPFCDQCAGPYLTKDSLSNAWLEEGYGGHWDTCPNRPGEPNREAITDEQARAAYLAFMGMDEQDFAEMSSTYRASSINQGRAALSAALSVGKDNDS